MGSSLRTDCFCVTAIGMEYRDENVLDSVLLTEDCVLDLCYEIWGSFDNNVRH